MAVPSPCPSALDLQHLLHGTLPASEQGKTIAHLGECAPCQQKLEELAGASPALLSAVGSIRRAPYTEEAPLRRVLDHLKTDATIAVPTGPDDRAELVRSLLQPVDAVQALGTLDGYEVVEVIGQGGMGVVLKAYDAALKRHVALKVLAPDLARDSTARRRFAREAQSAAAVRHEHVVVIHGVSEANGLPYLVMEHVAGGSLQDLLDNRGPLDWREVARIGAEIAAGLAAAHAQGLVHRDVKPSNILLEGEPGAFGVGAACRAAPSGPARQAGPAGRDRLPSGPLPPCQAAPSGPARQAGPAGRDRLPSGPLPPCQAAPSGPARQAGPEGQPGASATGGRVKIADFGLARLADEARLTQSGVLTGTPMFMAPEQARGEALDHRADLFSLGSVLYTLCTGREPFPSDSPVVVLRHVCETTPPPIRDLNPAIPAWLAATIERLHAKDPADRFDSAAEVAELLAFNLEHPDAPRFPPPLPRKRRWFRSRLLAATAAAGLLLIGAWAAMETIRRAHEESAVPLRATLTGHAGPVWSVAFAPDGLTLATGSDDSTLRFWDAATGQEKDRLTVQDSAVMGLSFAHSGRFLLSSGGDGVLRIWDAATHKEQGQWSLHGTVRRAPLSPDDRTVAVASGTRGVELWNLQSHSLLQTLPGGHGTILPIVFAPDGRTLAAGDTGGFIHLWDAAIGAELASFRGDALSVRALAFSPDGRVLASAGNGDHDVKLWDTAGRQPIATLSSLENDPLCLAFSPNGRQIACGTRGGVVKIWDVAAARLLARLTAHRGSVWSLAFSPDGRTLATVGEDRVGKLWDVSGLGDASP